MATAQQFLDVANAQLGIGEDPPGSNRNKFTAWFGVIGAWCAMFQSWCMAQVGMGQLRSAWVDDWMHHAQDGSWGTWVGQYDEIRPGDLAIFDWDGGSSDHIAAVNRVFDGGQWESIEGNWADQVTRVTRGRANISGFVRPRWDAAKASRPAPSGSTVIRAAQLYLTVVRAAQHKAAIGVDGIDGPETQAAVKDFQKFANDMYAYTGSKTRLAVDGVVGPATLPVLAWWATAFANPVPKRLPVPSGTPNLHVGSPSGDPVRQLQTALNRVLGTRLVVDGEIGLQTDKALRTYQTSRHLQVDGVYGPATAKTLAAEPKLTAAT